jgi:hypothetical protein
MFSKHNCDFFLKRKLVGEIDRKELADVGGCWPQNHVENKPNTYHATTTTTTKLLFPMSGTIILTKIF